MRRDIQEKEKSRQDIIYVYGQKIVGGKQAFTIDSNGNSKSAGANVNTRYFIYLQVPETAELSLTELCIDGKLYHFSVEDIVTPVVLKRQFPGDKKYDTLVAATTQKVYRIIKNDIIDTGKGNNDNVSTYPVVVKYKINGKKRTAKTKDIKYLPEVLMQ
jgi:hypothetical protein